MAPNCTRAAVWALVCCVGAAAAQPAGVVSSVPRESAAAYEARMRWWREARFGLFIHWGPVSVAGTEIGWSRGAERRGAGGKGEVPAQEYDTLYERFNPARFSAGAWARLAKQAGMRYVVFTAKHHDGFAMFDSALTDYKVTRSPFGRDVTAELASAVRGAGLRMGLYYSPPDWRHPDYRTATHARYITYLHGQVRELMTRYGRIGVLWFDGLGGAAEDWDAERMVAEAHRAQRGLIVNNRAGLPADFDTPEQEIGHYQTGRPWETCMTLGDQWSYRPNDRIKSLEQCIHTLARCAGGDGNLLLNVGPTPTGEIEPRQAARLLEIGAWLRRNGASIYGTRGGPFRPDDWGAATCRGRTIYLHVLKWPDGDLVLPAVDRRILRATLMDSGPVTVVQEPDCTRVRVAPSRRDPIDTVVRLELDQQAFTARCSGAGAAVSRGRPVKASNVYQGDAAWGPERAVDDDPGTRWATDAGVQSAWLEVDLGSETAVDGVVLREAIARTRAFEVQAWRGGVWQTVHRGQSVGPERVVRFAPVRASRFRVVILDASDGPTFTEVEFRGAAGAP